MSRKRRVTKKPHTRARQSDPPVAKVKGPPDVLAMIPYLLGFQPVESLVLVALEGPRRRFGPVLRVDLVPRELWDLQAAQIVGVAVGNRMSRVLVVVFSSEPDLADPLAALVLGGLKRAGVALEDAFRADGRRWWSYTCRNSACCNPAGAPYDVTTAQAAAEAVMAGMSFAADREALRGLFTPADVDRRQEVEREVAKLSRVSSAAAAPVVGPVGLSERVKHALADPASSTTQDIAWLAVAVQSTPGVDRALSLISRTNAAEHFEVWRTVMCHVGDELLPDVGCLAAYTAWLDGRGVLASHAVDEVLAVAPGHEMALGIERLLVNAVNPRTWWERYSPRQDDGVPPPLAG